MSNTPRDIAVFIDGTWNRADTSAPTNVRKLYQATFTGQNHGREQVTFYVSGVGTRPRFEGAELADAEYQAHLQHHLRCELPLAAGLARPVLGGAFGRGTAARIRAMYAAICGDFDRHRGDKVFLFGFSRGALAARSLAGFLEKVGLLLRDKLDYVGRAYELYEFGNPADSELGEFLYRLTGRRVLSEDDEAWLPLHFIGVWDTVAALGLPSRLGWLSAPYTEYHQVEVPPNVMHARHALALHELRGAFEPLLWSAKGRSDLEQVWFLGAHADVGGGYRLAESALSILPLLWMAKEAADKGLRISLAALSAHTTGPPEIHHEIRGLFLATWPTVRRWLKQPYVDHINTFHFHESVCLHLMSDPMPTYAFAHPFVNSALRRVDALAVPRIVTCRLLGCRIVR